MCVQDKNLGPEYQGFLHRHPAKPDFPEMTKHVVVDIEDWVIARNLLKKSKLKTLECKFKIDDIVILKAEQNKPYNIRQFCILDILTTLLTHEYILVVSYLNQLQEPKISQHPAAAFMYPEEKTND